jgi:hypothetical protein
MDSGIASKEQLLKVKLLDFYKIESNLKTLLPIILQQTRLSLRSLDWFVTNYSKKYNTNYVIERNGEKIYYFPFKTYKSQLKAYSKKFCDPFCRRERVIFDYRSMELHEFNPNLKLGHKDYIITTLGQLNFFKFAILDNIIKYSLENIDEIELDMNNTLKQRETEKLTAKTTNFMELKSIKRKELSIPGNKSVHITRISAVIKFI